LHCTGQPSSGATARSRRSICFWPTGQGQLEGGAVTLRDGGPFAFAGLWERWHGEEGDVQSCSIVTTDANELMRPLHDRMPVILDPKDYAAWLDQTPRPKEELPALLRAFPSEAMKAVPVSTMVNSFRTASSYCPP
jgi:putative SOS response-associated peptidase YedK